MRRAARRWVPLVTLVVVLLALTLWRLLPPGPDVPEGASPSGTPGSSKAQAPARSSPCPKLAEPRGVSRAASRAAPPVLLVAEAPLLALLDGVPWYSGPEAPRRLEPGPHTLRLETQGHAPLQLRFEVEPHQPVLLHGAALPGLGITLLRLGGRCLGCVAPLAPPNFEPSDGELARDPAETERLLREAAGRLRGQDWAEAAKLLRRVPLASRAGAGFSRLAAWVLADAGMRDSAEALLLEDLEQHDTLQPLLTRLRELVSSERARRRTDVSLRWNALTERLSSLLQEHGEVLPGTAAESSRRFAELSAAFADATRDAQLAQQEQLVAAADATLESWVEQMRRARPEDCALQTALERQAAP